MISDKLLGISGAIARQSETTSLIDRQAVQQIEEEEIETSEDWQDEDP